MLLKILNFLLQYIKHILKYIVVIINIFFCDSSIKLLLENIIENNNNKSSSSILDENKTSSVKSVEEEEKKEEERKAYVKKLLIILGVSAISAVSLYVIYKWLYPSSEIPTVDLNLDDDDAIREASYRRIINFWDLIWAITGLRARPKTREEYESESSEKFSEESSKEGNVDEESSKEGNVDEESSKEGNVDEESSKEGNVDEDSSSSSSEGDDLHIDQFPNLLEDLSNVNKNKKDNIEVRGEDVKIDSFDSFEALFNAQLEAFKARSKFFQKRSAAKATARASRKFTFEELSKEREAIKARYRKLREASLKEESSSLKEESSSSKEESSSLKEESSSLKEESSSSKEDDWVFREIVETDPVLPNKIKVISTESPTGYEEITIVEMGNKIIDLADAEDVSEDEVNRIFNLGTPIAAPVQAPPVNEKESVSMDQDTYDPELDSDDPLIRSRAHAMDGTRFLNVPKKANEL